MSKVLGPNDKRKSNAGRPTKFTEEATSKLINYFEQDCTVAEACSQLGLSSQQFYERCKADKGFADKMNRARKRPAIYAKHVLFNSMSSNKEDIALKASVEYLKRRTNEYRDKIDSNVDLDAEVKSEVDLRCKTMIELEQRRKSLLGF